MLVKWKFVLHFPDDNDDTEVISSETNVVIDLYKESTIPKNLVESYYDTLKSAGYAVYDYKGNTVLAITDLDKFKQSHNNDMQLSKDIDGYIRNHNREHNLKDLLE